MRPDERDLDAELRGHLALSVRERIECGETPAEARRQALAELGHLPAVRESMRRVWHGRWLDLLAALGTDLRIALRSLRRAPGFSAAVVTTLALGIGANAAIVSVVRQVLLQPLANQDEGRLVFIRQTAPGLGAASMAFSVPEIGDLSAHMTGLARLGDFSTIDFTLVGLGEPRVVHAGVVSSRYFDVMGLRPVLGRLLDSGDDGPEARGAAVLTHRFWRTSVNGDPAVVGRRIRLGTVEATVVGVLEPAVPYPADTGIIANVVTSPHHLGATMVEDRTHRMTELFGRLAPGVTIDDARVALVGAHGAMAAAHPDAYPADADMRIEVSALRTAITAPARSALLMLVGAAVLTFAIACANVANLMLARAVRRERELTTRAAIGASAGALRRTLLAESLVLCGGGALFGVALADPFLFLARNFATRYSVRAYDVSPEPGLVWVGAGLSLAAAVVLAYIPRLPLGRSPGSGTPVAVGPRAPRQTSRRLRALAVVQVTLSFVLIAGAGSVGAALVALQAPPAVYDASRVLAIDVPMPLEAAGPPGVQFVETMTDRVGALPGVVRVAAGSMVPWRDAGLFGAGTGFGVDGYAPSDARSARARLRNVTPGFFATVGLPFIAGRDFTADDRQGGELVVIVSESLASRIGRPADVVGRRFWWTEAYFGPPRPRRIVGIVADAHDERLEPEAALTVYHPFRQMPYGGRLFVLADGDPYALVEPITRTIRDLAADQPVERAATLADVRATVLGPRRMNAMVLAGFGTVALVVAVVGIAGVLAFSVSARTREFGVRLAMGSTPWRLLAGVLGDGVRIIVTGLSLGAILVVALGLALVPAIGAAAAFTAIALTASLMPAVRAARVDITEALRLE